VGENWLRLEVATPLLSVTKSPGTVEGSSGAGTVAWINPANAKASDNAYATVALGVSEQQSRELRATNYGFSIPEGARVEGFVLGLERKASAGEWPPTGVFDQAVQLVKAGALVGSNEATANLWGLADAVRQYGASASSWGAGGWTVSEVNAASMGVSLRVKGANATASVDHMPLTCYYRKMPAYTVSATVRWDRGYY
jgi:hypothetical protein